MMWFWRRKEVYVGNSMPEFNRVRQILDENHVRNDYRMSNTQRMDFGRSNTMGRWGTDPRFDTLYYVYVDRLDYETAKHILLKKSRNPEDP